MWFAIKNTPATFPTSAGRNFVSYRTRLSLRVWSSGRRIPSPVLALWDTGADFVVMSELAARRLGVPFDHATEAVSVSGSSGSSAGLLIRLGFQWDQVDALRGTGFVADCVVLLDSTLPVLLLGNLFVRRNFHTQTAGERRTFFRLRERAPDAVPAARLTAPPAV